MVIDALLLTAGPEDTGRDPGPVWVPIDSSHWAAPLGAEPPPWGTVETVALDPAALH
jgi:hypothetical protein